MFHCFEKNTKIPKWFFLDLINKQMQSAWFYLETSLLHIFLERFSRPFESRKQKRSSTCKLTRFPYFHRLIRKKCQNMSPLVLAPTYSNFIAFNNKNPLVWNTSHLVLAPNYTYNNFVAFTSKTKKLENVLPDDVVFRCFWIFPNPKSISVGFTCKQMIFRCFGWSSQMSYLLTRCVGFIYEVPTGFP